MSSDTTKNEDTNSQKRLSGGSVVVWLMALPNGLLCYKLITVKLNSNAYLELLQTTVVPISTLNFGDDFWLLADNASVHKSAKVSDFMI